MVSQNHSKVLHVKRRSQQMPIYSAMSDSKTRNGHTLVTYATGSFPLKGNLQITLTNIIIIIKDTFVQRVYEALNRGVPKHQIYCFKVFCMQHLFFIEYRFVILVITDHKTVMPHGIFI